MEQRLLLKKFEHRFIFCLKLLPYSIYKDGKFSMPVTGKMQGGKSYIWGSYEQRDYQKYGIKEIIADKKYFAGVFLYSS